MRLGRPAERLDCLAIAGLKWGLERSWPRLPLSQGSDAVISGEYTFRPLRVGASA